MISQENKIDCYQLRPEEKLREQFKSLFIKYHNHSYSYINQLSNEQYMKFGFENYLKKESLDTKPIHFQNWLLLSETQKYKYREHLPIKI